MKRIIVLYGPSNCGKTQTLDYLREIIREHGGQSISIEMYPSGDCSEAFLYKGVVISVGTGGDIVDMIEENFLFAEKWKANIIVTASRTRGAGVDHINQKAEEYGLQVEWYRKSYERDSCENTMDSCNKETAQFLFGKL